MVMHGPEPLITAAMRQREQDQESERQQRVDDAMDRIANVLAKIDGHTSARPEHEELALQLVIDLKTAINEG